ncbi:glutaredoxin domain-containing cysteine-rich protein 1 [Tanacetum coccineum]
MASASTTTSSRSWKGYYGFLQYRDAKDNIKRRSFSFHTLEELENNTKAAKKPAPGLKKTESFNELTKFGARLKRTDQGTKSSSQIGSFPPPIPEGYKSLKENPFLLRDQIEREQQGLPPLFMKRNPLEDYPEICPPGGADKVVIYSTSLGGIRRTYEDCNQVRSIMELHGFVYEERDISLHGEFRTQLRELLVDSVSDSVSVPRMFVKGRYIGGVDEIVGLNETGRLRRILSRVGIEKQVGRQACEGCGGARPPPPPHALCLAWNVEGVVRLSWAIRKKRKYVPNVTKMV